MMSVLGILEVARSVHTCFSSTRPTFGYLDPHTLLEVLLSLPALSRIVRCLLDSNK